MLSLRLAQADDAPALAELFDLSNNGLGAVGFAALAEPGEDWRAAAARMIRRGDVEYAYTSTIVALWDEQLAGMMIFNVQPDPMPSVLVDLLPPCDRAFAALRQLVPGSLYLRNMAVFPAFRGKRIGEALVSNTIAAGIRIGLSVVSAIVHETNTLLITHYAKRGMAEAARYPVLEHPSYAAESSWILLKGETNRAMDCASALDETKA
jgi:ribosomal protein S18 acetylase RimI-like enzyme